MGTITESGTTRAMQHTAAAGFARPVPAQSEADNITPGKDAVSISARPTEAPKSAEPSASCETAQPSMAAEQPTANAAPMAILDDAEYLALQQTVGLNYLDVLKGFEEGSRVSPGGNAASLETLTDAEYLVLQQTVGLNYLDMLKGVEEGARVSPGGQASVR